MSANKLNWARHTSIDNIQDMYGLSDAILPNVFAPELISYKDFNGNSKTLVKAVVYGSSQGNITNEFQRVPAGSQITLIGAATATEDGVYVKTSDEADATAFKFIAAADLP